VQKREEARESRRKLFLKNVRERADDKAWERRGGDQEVSFVSLFPHYKICVRCTTWN